MSALAAVFRRDLALAWRAGGGALAPLGYFVGATVLLPLAVGSDLDLLRRAGPPLLWVAAALAALTVLERLFQADLEDGGLDQLFLSEAPLELLVFVKGAALWLGVGVPIALAAAPAALALNAPPALLPAIVASLAIGMAAFIGAGLIGAAVSASVKRGGVLIAIIVLPLYAPPIVFGAAVAAGAGFGGDAFPLLCACALASVALGPVFAAAALRIQAD